MVSTSFKIFLGAAATALLALSHAEAAPSIPTLAEISSIDKDYQNQIFEPTKTFYQCRSNCYNDALRSTLGKGSSSYGKVVDEVDSCVANEIRDFKTFDDILAYEKKRRLHEITVSQYCVDELLSDGKGKVPFFQIATVQLKTLNCSDEKCKPPYGDAALKAFNDALKRYEAVARN